MTTAVVHHLNKKREEARIERERVETQAREMNIRDGRNVLVYRGVPYVRSRAYWSLSYLPGVITHLDQLF